MVAKKNISTDTLVIEETIPIAHLEISKSKAYDINLIKSKANRFVAISNMVKTKAETEWRLKKAMWLPFDNIESIVDILDMAHKKGLELYWDKPMAPPPSLKSSNNIVQAIDDVQAALDNLKEAIAANKNEVTQEQLSLFNKLTNTLFK